LPARRQSSRPSPAAPGSMASIACRPIRAIHGRPVTACRIRGRGGYALPRDPAKAVIEADAGRSSCYALIERCDDPADERQEYLALSRIQIRERKPIDLDRLCDGACLQ